MNEQLQTERKLDLEACMATSKLHRRIEMVNLGEHQLNRSQTPDLPSQLAIEVAVEQDLPIVNTIDTVSFADLKAGKSFLDIKHHGEPGDPPKPYYSTSITNRSAEKLRIDRFATFTQVNNALVLYSITGGLFSAQQFQEWYELGDNSWIEPGQVVIDPNNHSHLGVYWTYFGTTASGAKFVAGAPWLGKPWWQLW
jgi:hypothetical protein